MACAFVPWWIYAAGDGRGGGIFRRFTVFILKLQKKKTPIDPDKFSEKNF